MNYRVALKHSDGTVSYLSHRGRTEWSLRTARKHRRDCVREKVYNAKFPNVVWFALVAA